MATINRSEVARARAKAIAYKSCGKDHEAQQWAARLVGLLQCAEIIDPNNHGLVTLAYASEA